MNMLQYLVAPRPSFRSGFANIRLRETRKGGRNRIGADLEWKNTFTPQQIASAPAALQVVLSSNNVALVPGPLDESFLQGMRKSGFAVTNYKLNDEEYNWIVTKLPPDKAARWRNSGSKECALIACMGRVRVETQGEGWEQKDRYCDAPEGLKVEEVAKIQDGSLISDLSAAFQSGLAAVYAWASPSSVKNAILCTPTREATSEERERAMKMVRDYDDMAASVKNLEALEAKGAPMPREVQIRNQISRMILAQYAQPVALIKEQLGVAPSGSASRMRHRIRMERRLRNTDTFGSGTLILVIAAILVAGAIGAYIYGAHIEGVVAQEATKQKDMDVQYRQQLATRCSDPNLPDSIRKEVCGVLQQEAKNPTGYNPKNEVDWAKFAKWGAVGGLGIAAFFGIRYAYTESAALRQGLRRRLSRQQGV